jgi:hypothetical protein
MYEDNKHFQQASTELIFILLILYKIDWLHKTRKHSTYC